MTTLADGARLMSGTGDGNVPLIGRKLFAFGVYVVSLTMFVFFSTKFLLPINEITAGIVVQGMWMVTYVGLLVVGGQTAIDTLIPILLRWADAYAMSKTGKSLPSETTQEEVTSSKTTVKKK